MPLLSMTGFVFAIHSTEVKPPFKAALEPVRNVSSSSLPGCLKCVCISISPGKTILPLQSIVFASCGMPLAFIFLATCSILPSFIRTSISESILFAGSTTCPPFRRISISLDPLFYAGYQIQDRHPYGDAVSHLLEDHGIGAVSHLGCQLDAAVDRSWVHYKDVFLGVSNLLGIQSELHRIIPYRREKALPLAFDLYPKHIYDIGALYRLFNIVCHFDAEPFYLRRHKSRRTADCDLRAQFSQAPDI